MTEMETSEEAFLRSMQSQTNGNSEVEDNIGGNSHEVAIGDESQQIESSDEYDTTQDVQDVHTTGQQAQVSTPDSPDTSASVSRPNSSAAIARHSIPSSAVDTPSAFPAPPNTSDQPLAHQSALHNSVEMPNQASVPAKALPGSQKARLPNDIFGILEDRIKEDSKGDIDAWLALIDEYKRRGKSNDVRSVYRRFLKAFPLAAEQWTAFIRFENEAGNREGVEKLFGEVLKELPNLELWTTYLDHVRRYFNVSIDKSGTASQTNHAAYQTVLDNVGIDKDAGKLWQDFIEFIKSGPGTLGNQDWQSQQKMDTLRKAYQDAISIPTQSVEVLWKDYSAFENGLNKMTGRQFLQKKAADYMSARSSYTELQNITRELNRTTLPKLPPALGFEGDVEYTKQVDLWQRWIQWEKDDPLVFKEENPATYRTRIMYVYKQALMALTFWPRMWFDAAEFCFANDMAAEGDDFLAQGLVHNPESSLLAFRRADRLELTTTNGNDDDSKVARGKRVGEPYNNLLDALYALIERAMAREKQDISRIEEDFAESNTEATLVTVDRDSDDDDDNDDGEVERKKKVVEDKKQVQIRALKAISTIQISLLSKCISHAWIALMRAMQRMQGKGKPKDKIGGSRQVFINSRTRGRITSDVWLAAALLEFHSSDIEASKRIFDRGWKTFPDDEAFALEYIKLLTNINDHTNARVVFEQTVSKLTSKPETILKAKPLFIFFHKHESQYGELSQIQSLESRMRDLFPDDPNISSFSSRFTLNSFDPTAIRPIISPATQTRPKAMLPVLPALPIPPIPIIPTIERPQSRQPTPTVTVIPALPIISSPKRSLEDAFDNDPSRPRKVARGESPNPLAGAAGRRLNQMRQGNQPTPVVIPNGTQGPPPPPPLPRDITFLLSIIPPASTYSSVLFKPEAMVNLIRETNIPNTVEQLPVNQRQSGGGQAGYYR